MAVERGERKMATDRKESKVKITASKLIRWAGVSAMAAGMLYVVVGLFHPVETLSTVTTTQWIVVHALASIMCFFGVLGMAGLYARQAERAGWAGMAGFVLFSLWFALMLGFTSAEAFILPPLASTAPTFVEGFLGLFTSTASEVPLGVLPTLWLLTAPLYMLGGLLFGIATFRAGILPRWAAGLFALGTVLGPAAVLLPPEHKSLVAVPVGLALAWLGYALWSERRESAAIISESAQADMNGRDKERPDKFIESIK
jgi:hypothetical protein